MRQGVDGGIGRAHIQKRVFDARLGVARIYRRAWLERAVRGPRGRTPEGFTILVKCLPVLVMRRKFLFAIHLTCVAVAQTAVSQPLIVSRISDKLLP
jgi:hypothetical protein